MSEFSIGFNGRNYHYHGYRYDPLSDAVNYATLQRSRAHGGDSAHSGFAEEEQRPSPEEVMACKAEAGGNDKVARAQLDAKYQPSLDASYKLRIARAEADLSVATERCDDKAGNVKDVCVKEAKAAEASAKAEAKAQLTTANAHEQAARTSTAANDKAGEKGAAARKDAASTKRDAEYTVAKEKCDAFAGDAKSNCMNEAKARFDRS